MTASTQRSPHFKNASEKNKSLEKTQDEKMSLPQASNSFYLDKIRSQTGSCLLIKKQFSSVAQLSPTVCGPVACSTPGLPVHHQLPKLAQTHIHRVSDAIQPSHSPLLPPSIFPSIRVGNESVLRIRWPKVLEFQLQHYSFQ